MRGKNVARKRRTGKEKEGNGKDYSVRLNNANPYRCILPVLLHTVAPCCSILFRTAPHCRCTPLCAVGPYCCILHHIAPWCPVPLRTAEIYCCIINTVVVLLPRSAPCFAILFHTAPSSCIFVPLRAVVPYCCMLLRTAPCRSVLGASLPPAPTLPSPHTDASVGLESGWVQCGGVLGTALVGVSGGVWW